MQVEAEPTDLEQEDLKLKLSNDDISGCTQFKEGLNDSWGCPGDVGGSLEFGLGCCLSNFIVHESLGLVKVQRLHFRWGLKFCCSNEFPGDGSIFGQGTIT